MKKIFTGIIFCLLLFGCKKEKFDYRNKFTGDYVFIEHGHFWALLFYDYDTTYTFNGKVSLGTKDNTIKLGGISEEPTIYEDGSLYLNLGYSEYYFGGEFESSTNLKYSYGQNAPGGGFDLEITGIKIKK